MKLRNPTGDLRHTWAGVDVRPGETIDVEMSDAENDWHRRHGMEVGGAEDEDQIPNDPGPDEGEDMVRQQAKRAGITNWWNKSIGTIKEELG